MKRHEIDFPPHPHDEANVVRTFKALADATRVELILCLSASEQSVGELVDALGAPQSSVSRHLAVLRAAELVSTRRDGTTVYYRLANAHVGDLVREAFSHAEHERLGLPDHGAEAAAATQGRRPVDDAAADN